MITICFPSCAPEASWRLSRHFILLLQGARIIGKTRNHLFTKYVHSIGFCIFPIPEVPVTQGQKRRVRVARVQADAGWTKRMKRGTTAAPSTAHPPNSVHPDDATTLWGLECLPADLCRALGGVSTRPSAVSDRLLRWPSGQDAGVWQPGQDGRAPRQLTSYRHTSGLEIEGMFQRSAALPDVERQRGT